MGASHHGGESKPNPQMDDLMKRFIEQVEGTAKREYPAGRIGPNDEGALACAIAADRTHGRVRIEFGKLISWLSVTPAEAVSLAELLIAKAREIETVHVTV